MRKMNTVKLWLVALLLLAPITGWIGYEGGRIVEYQRAVASAEHAGAALAGALEFCRSQQEAHEQLPADRNPVGLNLG